MWSIKYLFRIFKYLSSQISTPLPPWAPQTTRAFILYARSSYLRLGFGWPRFTWQQIASRLIPHTQGWGVTRTPQTLKACGGGCKSLDTGSDVVWFRQKKNPKGRRFRSWIDAVRSQLKVHMRETTSRSSAAFLPRKLNITKPSSVTETSVDKVRQCVDRTGDTSVSPFFKKNKKKTSSVAAPVVRSLPWNAALPRTSAAPARTLWRGRSRRAGTSAD